MVTTVETNLQPRKEWVAPELKKTSVEVVTGSGAQNKPKPDRYNATISS